MQWWAAFADNHPRRADFSASKECSGLDIKTGQRLPLLVQKAYKNGIARRHEQALGAVGSMYGGGGQFHAEPDKQAANTAAQAGRQFSLLAKALCQPGAKENQG